MGFYLNSAAPGALYRLFSMVRPLRYHDYIDQRLFLRKEELSLMSIVDFIAVMNFGLTCFGLGYSFGKDNNKTQKQPLRS